jgi:hypothetical protein
VETDEIANMELSDLSEDEQAILLKLLSQRVGSPCELPSRVEEVNIPLAEKLESLDYDDLDHLFMRVVDRIFPDERERIQNEIDEEAYI